MSRVVCSPWNQFSIFKEGAFLPRSDCCKVFCSFLFCLRCFSRNSFLLTSLSPSYTQEIVSSFWSVQKIVISFGSPRAVISNCSSGIEMFNWIFLRVTVLVLLVLTLSFWSFLWSKRCEIIFVLYSNIRFKKIYSIIIDFFQLLPNLKIT